MNLDTYDQYTLDGEDIEEQVKYLSEGLDNLVGDRKSTRLNSSHDQISYAVFCLKKKKKADKRDKLK